MDSATTEALVVESTRRAGLLWVRRQGSDEPPRPVWHLWHDGRAYLLTGGAEQPAPDGLGLDDSLAEVTVASKDKGSRLIVWTADVSSVTPDSDEWHTVVPALLARRLNSPDGDDAPARWRRECTVLRLTPTGTTDETP